MIKIPVCREEGICREMSNMFHIVSASMHRASRQRSEQALSPKYQQLAEILKEDIRSNWKPNQKYYSQRNLISRYGVSFSTVERALGVLCDEGLLCCSHGKGTFIRDHTGRQETGISVYLPLRGAKTNVTGSYYSGGIFNGIERFLSSIGASLTLLPLDDFEKLGSAALLREQSGMIFIFAWDGQRDTVEALRASGLPLVVIGNYSSVDASVPVVDGDNEGGVRLMTDYLVQRGHCRIAYIYSEMNTVHEADRLRTFKGAMGDFGLPVVPEWCLAIGSGLTDEKRSALSRIFRAGDRPTAIAFSSFYSVTMSVMSELRQMGLKLPDDVSVIGFDDPEWAVHNDPPLTVIRQPLEEVGRCAAQKLVSLINGKVVVRRELLPMKVVERDSVIACR